MARNSGARKMRSLADNDSISASAAPATTSFPTAAAMAISNGTGPVAAVRRDTPGNEQREADAGVVEELEARGPLDQREMARGIFQQHGFMDHRELEMRGGIVDGDAGVFGQQHHDEGDRGEDDAGIDRRIGCAR